MWDESVRAFTFTFPNVRLWMMGGQAWSSAGIQLLSSRPAPGCRRMSAMLPPESRAVILVCDFT